MTLAQPVRALAAETARTGYGRLLALLSALTNDVAAAEDALGDTFERALRTWPESGIPANPQAWLLTVARNRLRDRWKSAAATRTQALDPESPSLPALLDEIDPDATPDRRLELMLVCAHPAIAVTDRTPLMLNTVLGFTAAQIARAYAVPAPTMSTRLTRAKARIKAARIPFRIPDRDDLPPRLDALLEAAYAAYTIEWSTGPAPRELPPQGWQLAEVLAHLLPRDAQVRGLAALVSFSAARSPGPRSRRRAVRYPGPARSSALGPAPDRAWPGPSERCARPRAARPLPARSRHLGPALLPDGRSRGGPGAVA